MRIFVARGRGLGLGRCLLQGTPVPRVSWHLPFNGSDPPHQNDVHEDVTQQSLRRELFLCPPSKQVSAWLPVEETLQKTFPNKPVLFRLRS